MPHSNEKFLLSSREEIDNFFDQLNEKRIIFVSVPHTVDYWTKMAMCAVESAAHFNPGKCTVIYYVMNEKGGELGNDVIVFFRI